MIHAATRASEAASAGMLLRIRVRELMDDEFVAMAGVCRLHCVPVLARRCGGTTTNRKLKYHYHFIVEQAAILVKSPRLFHCAPAEHDCRLVGSQGTFLEQCNALLAVGGIRPDAVHVVPREAQARVQAGNQVLR
jgi:hypothetical protein